MNNESKLIQTYATYKKTVFRNDFTGYCVFQVIAADESKIKAQDKRLNGTMTCVGNVPDFRLDTPLYMEGIPEKTKYGYQLRVTKILEKSWDVNGLAAYLCNICSGVGITTADAIAEKYCDTLFELIQQENAAEILSDNISSLSYDTAVVLCDTINTTRMQKIVYDAILPQGGTWAAAIKITKKIWRKLS